MKNQKLPSLVIIAVLTVITAVFWVGLDLYRTLTTAPPPKVSAEIMAPLNPVLDSQTLNALQQKQYGDESTKNTTKLQSIESTQ